MADPTPHWVTLDGEADVPGFRRAARRLLAGGVAPQRVQWRVATAAHGELFGPADEAAAEPAGQGPSAEQRPLPGDDAPQPPVNVPAFVVPLCERAALHSDADRFGLLYRLLWRLVHEPGLRHDPLDPDRLQAEQMARAVRRDMHKMTAFVRFRPLTLPPGSAATVAPPGTAPLDSAPPCRHVAWFEPIHHIVEAVAPFFMRRFAQMHWAILTPERSVRWDGRALEFGPGARREDAPPADAGEQHWLTYYEHIFNPARLKLAMMKKEMPVRYWRNLPEAALISPLTARSAERAGQMLEQPATEPAHRRPAASRALPVPVRAAAFDGAPANLQALHLATEYCRECPIGALATQAVNGEGPAQSRLMLVGEQPGDQEDLRGRPFVGPAGQLLDRALQQLGWPRDQLFLTNAVRHFKYELRGKRRIHKTPAQREAAACLHWLESEIGLVRPEAAIALGATAARALLGRAVGVTSERGQWLERGDGLPVLVTLHPSALLRLPDGDRAAAFEHWLADLRQAARYAEPSTAGA